MRLAPEFHDTHKNDWQDDVGHLRNRGYLWRGNNSKKLLKGERVLPW